METRLEPGRMTKRWFLTAVLSIFVIQITLMLAVQIEARIIRARSERLQSEMRSLIVGQSTMRDVQALSARWDKLGRYVDGCSMAACEYDIVVSRLPDKPWVTRILLYAGRSRFARAALSVQLKAGVVTEAGYWLSTYVPEGYGPRWEAERVKQDQMTVYSTSRGGYFLVARVLQKEALSEMWRGSFGHSEYLLSRPSGCENCLGFWIEFTPRASLRDRYRMTDFNFSCITRWTPCKDEEDIMPDAGKEYEGEVIEELKGEREQPSRG